MVVGVMETVARKAVAATGEVQEVVGLGVVVGGEYRARQLPRAMPRAMPRAPHERALVLLASAGALLFKA